MILQENRITKKFEQLKKAGKKALITYVMGGDPDIETSEQVLYKLAESGADIIEIGVPFTDPLADGPVIQLAGKRSLDAGTRTRDIFELVKRIRSRMDTPVVLMLYYNLVYKYGEERFIKDAVSSGIDGMIIPDLTPEEGGELIKLAKQNNFALIFLLAPTSTPQRIELITNITSGFLYYVSIKGITGAKISNTQSIDDKVKEIKRSCALPVCVGFGISTPEEAKTLAKYGDGVIVGSAIVKIAGEYRNNKKMLIEKTGEVVKALSDAVHNLAAC